MKFISKNLWKELFQTTLQKQQWLTPFVEYLITLLIRKSVKLRSSLVHKLYKPRLRFIIVIVQSMHIVQSATGIIGKTISK